MKKFTKICAVMLAAVCTTGLAACSSSSGSSSSLSSKWYIRTSYMGIQPTSVYENDEDTPKEVLVYDISFEEDSGGNSVYSVSYNSGHTMTTEFYACEYDWSGTTAPEGYSGSGLNFNIPEEYQSDETETVYCYTYSFEISGTYTYTSTDETVAFSDKMESVCYFRSARNNLQPVFSYQYVKSTSPASFTPSGADAMCKEVEYEYTVYYNKDCTEVTTNYTELTMNSVTEKTIDLTDAENTLFDNGSVYTVMRAMNITSSLSMDIDIFIAAESNYSTYNVTGASAAALEDETIKNALVDAGYASDGDNLTYSAASLSYTGDLSGTSQTIWYATLSDDTSRNYCRSTMLKIELPISFGLGTLDFTLSEVQSQFNV